MPRRAGMALAGMVASIVGVVSCFMVVPSLLGAVFGFVGAHQIKASNGALTGIGMARTGWIVGLLGAVAGIVLWTALVVTDQFDDVEGRGIQVGTCVDLDADLDGHGLAAPTVPCDGSHDAEVFEIGWLNPTRDRAYPGLVAVGREADDRCAGEPFAEYVGVSSSVSALRIEVLTPPEGEWSDWRGEYACLLTAQEGNLTGSVHDSGR